MIDQSDREFLAQMDLRLRTKHSEITTTEAARLFRLAGEERSAQVFDNWPDPPTIIRSQNYKIKSLLRIIRKRVRIKENASVAS